MSKETSYLLAMTLIVLLLFQLLLLFTAVTIDSCLYAIWDPVRGDYFSPYWMFVAIAVLISVVTLVIFFAQFSAASIADRLGIGFLLIVLAYWLYNLWWLHRTFEVERGSISLASYYSERFKGRLPPIWWDDYLEGPAACRKHLETAR